MRIKGSELRKIIKEEIDRSYSMNEEKITFGRSVYRVFGPKAVADAIASWLRIAMRDAPPNSPIKNIKEGDSIDASGLIYSVTHDNPEFMKAMQQVFDQPADIDSFNSASPFFENMSIEGVSVSQADLVRSKLQRDMGQSEVVGTFSLSFFMPGPDEASESLNREIASGLRYKKV